MCYNEDNDAVSIMEIGFVYQLMLKLEPGDRKKPSRKLLKYALAHDSIAVQTHAGDLICRLAERGESTDIDLISELLRQKARHLRLPVTRRRLTQLNAYFKYSVTAFVGLVGVRSARGLHAVAESWHDAICRITGSGILRLIFRLSVPLVARIVFAREARSVIERSGKLEGELGPVLDYAGARRFFERPQKQRRKLLAFLEYCHPHKTVFPAFRNDIGKIVEIDEPFEYNFANAALLIQCSSQFDQGFLLLEELFHSESIIARYTSLRVLLYILLCWPEEHPPEVLIDEAAAWTRELLLQRREKGEPHRMPLDYAYPISQLCWVMSNCDKREGRMLMRFLSQWVDSYAKTANLAERIIIIRAMNQFQLLAGIFVEEATLQIVRQLQQATTVQEKEVLGPIALATLTELQMRYPEQCSAFLDDAGHLGQLDADALETIKKAKALAKQGLPEYAGRSANMNVFFQYILTYGGELRTELFRLLQPMEHSPSLLSYLVYLGRWFLCPENMKHLSQAALTVTEAPQAAPSPSQVAQVLAHLDNKRQQNRRQDTKPVP